MNQVYNLFNYHQLSSRPFVKQVFFSRPIKIGSFVVQLNSWKDRSLVDNVEDYYFKLLKGKIEKFKEQNECLDLNEELELDDGKDMLKIDGELDVFLQQILTNKNDYLLKQSKPMRTSEGSSKDNNLSNLEEGMSKMNLNKRNIKKGSKLLWADFIGLRATFAILLNCQYDSKKTFTILAEYFEGTIYLKLEKDNSDFSELVTHVCARKKLEIYFTEKFNQNKKSDQIGKDDEKKSTDDQKSIGDEKSTDEKKSTDDEKSTDEKSNKQSEFSDRAKHNLCFVFKNQVNRHSLVYSATMDSFEEEIPKRNPLNSDQIKSVEFKTSKEITDDKKKKMFQRYKTLKWWSKSVFSYTNKIIVAYWKGNMIAYDIQEYSLNDLTKLGDWNSRICFDQFDKILTFIENSFKTNKRDNLLKFHYESNSFKIVCQPSDQKILPDFYKKELSANSSNWRD